MQRDKEPIDPVKEAALSALKQMLDPLVDLMLDTGVTVHEFVQLVRGSAVSTAANRLTRDGNRLSKSRLSITTGLSRAEVARILSFRKLVVTRKDAHRNPARRILAEWYDNPKFLNAKGEPLVLSVFGRRKSFEDLVKHYGGGLPVRAMLDELTRMNVIENLADQRVQVKSRVPVSTGLTVEGLRLIGERGNDLLSTLASNLRQRSDPFFEATASIEDAELKSIPIIQREITAQAINFVTTTNALLQRSRVKHGPKSAGSASGCRLGVTVYYFQASPCNDIEGPLKPSPRKNLRRTRGKESKENYSANEK